ncbi:hypothetical protein HPC49_50210 [Pyxidicoccus fallax]|uniref:Carbohydrate binding module family 25 domain-containing protein n=1 Tax=Pyxidicoccus fallax TaxID=394095 RepID=A0A848LK70_9BACT|nr:DUF6209 family protein [Pyxidicoccus fallax]NMO18093.1 hypothetical protein [Pyxidicoccus fallax]NPC86349.1 hypothetical protein [Pyxidicoccus fallax]
MRRSSLLMLPLLLLGTAAAAQTSIPTITFNDGSAGWSIVQSAPLVPGGQVKIIYDTDRLPGCRGTINGNPAWSVTGSYQLNDGTVGSFYAGGGANYPGQSPEAVLDLPENGSLALWFHISNRWGCREWDSNYGNNFRFDVGGPRIVFGADWTTAVYGTLKQGGTVTVDYDITRLSGCRQTYNGLQTWDVEAQYRFDGGTVQTAPLTQVVGMSGREQVPAVITAPASASLLELWFRNWDRTSCQTWDSAYGQNYRFTLVP